MKPNWISVTERYPQPGQSVLCKYEGVYGPTAVVYTFDGVNHHFGHPSEPATHWCAITE